MQFKLLSILLVLGVPYPVYANNSINDFILAAQTDLNEPESSDSSENDMNIISSWVDAAQFRFKAGEDNNRIVQQNELSYELRVKPKVWGQRQLEKDILKLHLNQQNKQYNAALNIAMKKRYLILLKYLQQYNTTQYLLKLSELLAQEITLIQSQVMTDKFNAKKLLDAENMSAQSHNLALLNLARLNAIQMQIGNPPDTAETLLQSTRESWLISFAELSKNLTTRVDLPQFAPAIMEKHFKVEMTQAKNELLETEQQLGINLLRFTYKDNRNDEMAFQFGVNIPLGTHFNQAENQYQLTQAQRQLEHSIIDVQQALTEIKNEIGWLAEEIKLVDIQILRVQKQIQQEVLRTTPALLISLRKELVEHHKKSTDIKLKALDLYINYLSMSGQLSRQPLRNWIHIGIPELTSANADY